jgi:hypothetical protein
MVFANPNKQTVICSTSHDDGTEPNTMAKYGTAAGKSVKSAVHREKSGTLLSGKAGKGGKVKSRKQAIAIGLSEARKKGAKVPKKKSG